MKSGKKNSALEGIKKEQLSPYLWTREGWLYVCAVLDLFTRRIVGWAMAGHMTRDWCWRRCGWRERLASRHRG